MNGLNFKGQGRAARYLTDPSPVQADFPHTIPFNLVSLIDKNDIFLV
jgi:hypothetical protein